MDREEKQKAIDALKISAPVMAITQEEFNDYIQTLNKIMDWLEQQPCEDAISRQAAIDAMATWDWQELYLPIHFKQLLEELPPVTMQEKPNRSKFEFDKEQEQLDFVQPHKKIKVNLVKFDTHQYNDTISRQAAIDAMREETCGCCWDAKDILKHLPSVSMEKTGHWIEHEHNGIAHIECSKCLTWFLRPHLLRNSYCPNCGARMVEPQESEG